MTLTGGGRNRQGGNPQNDRRLPHAHDASAALFWRARGTRHRRVYPSLSRHGRLRHSQEK